MQTRQQTRRIQEQKTKVEAEVSSPQRDTTTSLIAAQAQLIEESKTAWYPTTASEANVLIGLSPRANSLGMTWLNIAVIYAAFQRTWPIVLNFNKTSEDLQTRFAETTKLTATQNLVPSKVDEAYTKAEKQIAEITDNQTKAYALTVLPSKAQFVHQLNISYKTAIEYLDNHK